jgi:hypothetical protein
MKFNTPTVIVTGRSKGKIILINNDNPVQPSITPASSNSLGTVEIKPEKSKVEKGIKSAEYTSIRDVYEP